MYRQFSVIALIIVFGLVPFAYAQDPSLPQVDMDSFNEVHQMETGALWDMHKDVSGRVQSINNMIGLLGTNTGTAVFNELSDSQQTLNLIELSLIMRGEPFASIQENRGSGYDPSLTEQNNHNYLADTMDNLQNRGMFEALADRLFGIKLDKSFYGHEEQTVDFYHAIQQSHLESDPEYNGIGFVDYEGNTVNILKQPIFDPITSEPTGNYEISTVIIKNNDIPNATPPSDENHESYIAYQKEWSEAEQSDAVNEQLDTMQKQLDEVVELGKSIDALNVELAELVIQLDLLYPSATPEGIFYIKEQLNRLKIIDQETRSNIIDLFLKTGKILPDREATDFDSNYYKTQRGSWIKINPDIQPQKDEKGDDGDDQSKNDLEELFKDEMAMTDEAMGEGCNGCTPLMFKINQYDSISYDLMYPETAIKEIPVENSRDTVWWYLPCGDNLELSRIAYKYTSGFLLYIDYDGDGKLTNCNEMLMSDHKAAFQRVQEQAVDSNYNGKLDSRDYVWGSIRAMDMETWESYTPRELGIKEFNIRNGYIVGGDYVHKYSKYMSGCDAYLHDKAYQNYVSLMGGEKWCVPLGSDDVRIVWVNFEGVVLNNGIILPLYDVIGGYYPLAK
jgi:hypothetical protein